MGHVPHLHPTHRCQSAMVVRPAAALYDKRLLQSGKVMFAQWTPIHESPGPQWGPHQSASCHIAWLSAQEKTRGPWHNLAVRHMCVPTAGVGSQLVGRGKTAAGPAAGRAGQESSLRNQKGLWNQGHPRCAWGQGYIQGGQRFAQHSRTVNWSH